MPKNDNAHSLRLVESLRSNAGADIANQLEERFPLSKSASPEKKHRWATETSQFLEAHFDTETVIRIRKDCKCNDGKSIAAKLLKYLHQANSLQQFVDDFNANETFASLEYLSERKLRFCYPQCYCACVKRVPGSVPKAWCYCTLGNIESIFKQVFPQHNPRATLIESIKTGGTRCIIEIEW